VLQKCGYTISKANLVVIDSTYTRGKELEVNKLFKVLDFTKEVKKLQDNIPNKLKEFETILSKSNEPNIPIGTHCLKPYECDAMNYCWNIQEKVPEHNIFEVLSKTKKNFELFHNGIKTLEDLKESNISLTDKQQQKLNLFLDNKTYINKSAIKEFLETLTYPLYHLDFETFQQPIPKFEGISPFMQIPFQYSIHIEQSDGRLEHHEFLAEEETDPRYELAKRLVEDIPTDVTVLAYNMSFEKSVIKKLADSFEDLAPQLMAIHDNIKDLMIPFQKKYYYTPAMKGSYSIKYVLPALVPDMAQAYNNLELVQNGSDAMQAYPKLASIKDKNEVKKLRDALLEYCKLDTLAMVKVLEKLKESVR
jgi:hypothetical protein